MEVDRGPDDVDLGVHQPAQTERDRRQVALEEPGVADDRDIGRELVALGLEPVIEMDRARLLLALEDVFDVDREAAAGCQQRPGGHQVGVDLALVVGSAAGEDPIADHDRLERWRCPQVERVDRLDVVVAVDKDGRGVGSVQPVGVDDRGTTGLDRFCVLEAGCGQGVAKPVGRGPTVVQVLAQRRDARDAKERLVRLEAGVLGLGQVRFEDGISRGHVRHCTERTGYRPDRS